MPVLPANCGDHSRFHLKGSLFKAAPKEATMRFFLSVLALACVGTANLAKATDFYVDNMIGDDRNNGLSPESEGTRIGPMRTIGRALKAAKAGDAIVLAKTEQPYRECITLQGARHSSDGLLPFRIIGNEAVLDGTVPVDENAWKFSQGTVFNFRPHLVGYQQLYIDGKPAKHKGLGSVDKLDQLEPLQWTMIDGRVYFCAEEGRLPQDYAISYCGHAVGITLYSVRGVEIQDVTVQGFQLDGINAHDNVFSTKIVGSILRGNGRSGIHVGGASRVAIEACLVGSNAVAQIHCSDYCKVAVESCDVLDSDPDAPPIQAAASSRVSVDGSSVKGN